ncbi:MAG: aminodeoxychorismate synthase component I [Mycobacteriaceae bacterium]|nr:aminodeoxychorismate synthase component I [Mycobacteriaceae bacterium]
MPSVTVALREALDGGIAPGHEALLVRADPDPFALVGCWAGGGALVGSCPIRHAPPDTDPLAVLADAGPCPRDAPAGFVGGGWFGYLGYALTDGPAQRPRLLPPFVLAFYDHLFRLDAAGQWWFEALWTPERDVALRARRDEFAARLRARHVPGPVSTRPWRMTPSLAGHARAVAAIRDRIGYGDFYQANVAIRLDSVLTGAPVDLFAAAAAALRPDRGAYLAGAWGAVASLSPELFLERHGEQVSSRPIKGTRRRVPESAEQACADLVASAKDRAENIMIVDLVRNDFGRIAQVGSVRVPQLAAVQAHPGVWHLVSEVAAQRRPDTDDADLLRASFPAGSVTGAPKIAAIGAIDELESSAREIFTGSIGFASPVSGLELSVVIRTFECFGERIWLDVGGGIVADSDPAAEAAEAYDKARPLLQAIGARLAPAPSLGVAPQPGRFSPCPAPRPDARGGLLETIKVHNGVPVQLHRHLHRLRASMKSLYGLDLPPVLEEEIIAAASGAGRVRLLAAPSGHVHVEPGPPAVLGPPERLEPVTVPGGIGSHKWGDRRWLDALSAAVAPAHPLLVDLDGFVLESATAAVLIVDEAGVLAAPPLDGRILPSVTRALVLERARAEGRPIAIRPIRLDELATAREVLLASAVRGVRPSCRFRLG